MYNLFWLYPFLYMSKPPMLPTSKLVTKEESEKELLKAEAKR